MAKNNIIFRILYGIWRGVIEQSDSVLLANQAADAHKKRGGSRPAESVLAGSTIPPSE